MQIDINNIIEDLLQVKNLLDRYVQTGSLSITEERAIVCFLIKYQETNKIVSYALCGIRNKADNDNTLAEFTNLLEATESFMAFYTQNELSLKPINFKADSEKHLKTFNEKYEQTSAEATSTWKKIQELSNRMDYMWETDSEYSALRKECDEKEDRYYNVLKPQVDKLYAEFKEQETFVAPIYYFKLEMLFILILKMKDISESVIEDINNIRKGGKA